MNSKLVKKLFTNLLLVVFIFFVVTFNLGSIDKLGQTDSLSYKPIVVQEGDTLWILAQKSDLQMDINSLINETMKYNHLYNTYIQPGQTLYIPCKDFS